MGQQSIEILDRQKYYDTFEEELQKQADKYYLYKNFRLGEDFCEEKVRHAQMFSEILCTDNCEIIDWIWKKVNIGLNCKDVINNSNSNINSLKYLESSEVIGGGSIGTVVDENCNWDLVEW